MVDDELNTEGGLHAPVVVRRLHREELAEADEIMRAAFDTFTGIESVFRDRDYVRTRWLADPDAALAAEIDGRLVGSNFAIRWGSVAFFGPLSVRPAMWDRGVARRLVAATMEVFDGWGIRHAGLFTFPQSARHHRLYQRFGFWPRFLTSVVVKRTAPGPTAGQPGPLRAGSAFTALSSADRERAIEACRELTGQVYDGLDVEREIRAVERHRLGEVLLLDDGSGLAGVAVCHLGAGTEAGSGRCYVKFGLVRPGRGAPERFEALVDACEALASGRGAGRVELGVNAGRHEAYAAVMARGYRAETVGVAMQRGDDPGYNRPGVWLVDDWR